MNYKTYADLHQDIVNSINLIPQNLDLVIGIPRSGMIPAYMISLQLNLPILSLSEFLEGSKPYIGRRINLKNDKKLTNVLVIDDSIDSGFAIEKAKKELLDFNFSFTYAAIYASNPHTDKVDFFFKHVPQPRVFQWNYKNHFIITKSCLDIDGVLCQDPTEYENDDGKNYRRFLLNAKPLFLPGKKVSCLVTSRLEKYRSETIKWLQSYDIEYNELFMLDLPSAAERRKLGNHAQFKASIYKSRQEDLFVESDWGQAKEIFKLSNKPVICTENDALINTYADIVFYENQKAKSNRALNDIFSDTTEIGFKYQQMFKDYEQLIKDNKRLILKNKKIENDKWYKLSKLNKKQKVINLFKYLFN